MKIYFDIETLPCLNPAFRDELSAEMMEDAEVDILAIRAPANYKKQESIDEWMATEGAARAYQIRESVAVKVDELHRKTSFDGALGHICVIGAAINDDEPVAFYSADQSADVAEARVLADFFHMLADVHNPARSTAPTFIGHNITGFDLRFMFQRAVILGVRPPACIPFQAKPWESTIFDTMTYFAGHGKTIKLDKLCKALGLPGKCSMDGSKVYDAYLDGRIEDIARYCRDEDVVQTREVYKRLAFIPPKDDLPF